MIVVRGRTPQAVRLAWILVVMVVPIVGGLMYLRLGNVVERRAVARHRRICYEVQHLADTATREPGDDIEIHDLELLKGARLIEALGGMKPSGGNRVRLFADTHDDEDHEDAFDQLVEDIDQAQSSCHLLFYIYLNDATGRRVADALIRATRRGVVCRLLVDGIGSRPFLGSQLKRALEAQGVKVSAALPVSAWGALVSRFDHRNHRKIVVIDGVVGWTGSQNLADAGFAPKARYAPWVDLMVRFEGPVVHDLQRIFVEDWLLDHGEDVTELLTPRPRPFADGIVLQVLPSGPDANTEAMKEVSLLAFLETDRELVLTTPYFVPDDATASAIYATARSGVRTIIIVPARNDSRLVGLASRSYYDQLLDAGVEIYEYQEGLLHAKTFTFDGKHSIVATANLDRRSFELNYEVSIVVPNEAFTRQLRALQERYLDDSVRVDPDDWRTRPLWRRMAENVAGLLAPLL
jgi:cardiolipin synthase